MMPPLCEVCDAEPVEGRDGFQTVSFADLVPLPAGITGHPDGLLWFCPAHIEQAQRLQHLRSSEAVAQIRASESSGS